MASISSVSAQAANDDINVIANSTPTSSSNNNNNSGSTNLNFSFTSELQSLGNTESRDLIFMLACKAPVYETDESQRAPIDVAAVIDR